MRNTYSTNGSVNEAQSSNNPLELDQVHHGLDILQLLVLKGGGLEGEEDAAEKAADEVDQPNGGDAHLQEKLHWFWGFQWKDT